MLDSKLSGVGHILEDLLESASSNSASFDTSADDKLARFVALADAITAQISGLDDILQSSLQPLFQAIADGTLVSIKGLGEGTKGKQ